MPEAGVPPRPDRDTRREAARAHEHLRRLDDPLSALVAAQGIIDAYGSTRRVDTGGPLGALVLSIIGQQISRQAAAAVFGRVGTALAGDLAAGRMAALSEDTLREAGLSYPKARAVRELAARVADGNLSFEGLAQESDEQVVAELIGLRGIGPWSAQVFLLRTLRRPDVFPAGDLGLRQAIATLDRLSQAPAIRAAEQRALAWRPYRSYAAKYLWSDYGDGRRRRPLS